ncbi:MAG: hypothetical protein HQM08_16050 [Candidatus Riflebacteria bacterium]|nr:hypothetical protein [Candidatus Riflebacteria bacterium]
MSIIKAFTSIAFFTVLSRVSGFLRVAFFAAFFGTGTEADVFLSVMILPELMYKFTSEGLITGAAVPIFVTEKPGTQKESQIFWTLFWGVSISALFAIIAMLIFAKQICSSMVPGFLLETQSRMVEMWKMMAFYILFSVQGSLLTAFLNARQIFGPPAIGPFLVNVVVILGIYLNKEGHVEFLVPYVLMGIFIQTFWLFHISRKIVGGMIYPWSRGYFQTDVWLDFLKKSAPIAIWVFLTPIIPLWERFLLSKQGVGAVSTLNYTDKLIYLPLGVISLSLASAIFPSLSESGEKVRIKILGKSIWWGLFVLLLPATLIFYLCSEQIMYVVFARGKFQAAEIASTSSLLTAYSTFLIPISTVMLINRFFFAEGFFRITFMVGIVSVFLQVLLDTYFVEKIGWLGVGYGATAGSFFQMILLCIMIAWKKSFESVKIVLTPIVVTLGVFFFAGLYLKPIWMALLAHFSSGKTTQLIAIVAFWLLLQIPLFGLALVSKRYFRNA